MNTCLFKLAFIRKAMIVLTSKWFYNNGDKESKYPKISCKKKSKMQHILPWEMYVNALNELVKDSEVTMYLRYHMIRKKFVLNGCFEVGGIWEDHKYQIYHTKKTIRSLLLHYEENYVKMMCLEASIVSKSSFVLTLIHSNLRHCYTCWIFSQFYLVKSTHTINI